jgi:hypothetical protein
MRRDVILGCVVAGAMTFAVSAQDPQTGQGSGSRAAQSRDNQTITVTGCLSNAASTTGARTGTGGTGTGTSTGTGTGAGTQGTTRGGQQQFVLNNATIGKGSGATGSAGTGTSGTAGSGAAGTSAGMGTTYRLTGGNNEELQKYLNSKVEIRGTLQSGNQTGKTGATGTGTGAGTGTGTGSGTATTSGTSSSAGASGQRSQDRSGNENMQTLRVTSVTQIAATCESR